MKCDNCGMNLNGNETNCPNCGKVLNNNQNMNQPVNSQPINNQPINNQQVSNQLMNNQNGTIMVNQNVNGQPMNSQNMMYNQNGFNQNGYNGNMQNNNINGNKGDKKKFIVIGILVALLVLLGILALVLFSSDGTTKRVKDGSRTIMIYLDGSNLESEGKIATIDLDSLDTDKIDLDKMNILVYTGGTEKWHNFIKNDENALYILEEDGFKKIETYEQKNMGDADTLQELLDYGYENYETQYYDLILYDHGGAIDGAIYDDFTKDHLSLEDFDDALDNSAFNDNNKLNTVLFMTCLNGTIEVANVFAPYTRYMISSEEVTNGGEIPELDFLNEVTTDDDEISYGKKYIKHYEEVVSEMDPFGFGTMPMYSIVDLSKVAKVSTLFNDFIDGIDIEKDYSDIVKIRSKMYQYAYTLCNISQYDMVDLYTLVEKLDKYSDVDAQKVLDALDDAIVYNWSKQDESHGLSVYFPYKANSSIQNAFLKIYKKLDEDSSYYKFIGKFNSLSTSKGNSSFVKFNNTNNEAIVSSEKEFSLQLDEEQQRDYAESIYMIFRKTSDGLYNPIYSSDNVDLTSNGLLKTKLENNLIKLTDVSDPGFERYLTIIERNSTNKKTLLTSAVLFAEMDENYEVKSTGATVYFDTTDDVPKISSYVSLDSDNGTGGTVINPDDYKIIDFVSSSYDILDENGNYVEEWDNKDVITLYELNIKDIELKRSSLDDREDYYCVFKIWDIYGNVYYSKLLGIK